MGRRWRATLLGLGLLMLGGMATAQPVSFVRVKVDTANLRNGPGTEFTILRRAYENDPLEVIAKKGPWVHVRDFEGYESWISASLTDEKPAVIVTVRLANVRSGPGTQHPVAFTAERGVALLRVGQEDQWFNVQHSDGDAGWIHRRLVWGPNRR